MSVDVESVPRRAATRWWRPEPNVVAYLRAQTTSARREPWKVMPTLARPGAAPAGGGPTAFAPTQWPDTEWADTRSDFTP